MADTQTTTYTLTDMSGGVEESILATSMADARRQAREWALEGDWDTADGTIWVDVHIQRDTCGDDGEENCPCTDCTDGVRSIAIDPEEPDCDSDAPEHEWASPHSLVYGLETNPGVQGHGGGIVAAEVCMHCGCERTTDTWAQRSDTGEQGLTSISYEEGRHDLEQELTRLHEDGEIGSDAHSEGDGWTVVQLTPPEPWVHQGVLVVQDDEDDELTWWLSERDANAAAARAAEDLDERAGEALVERERDAACEVYPERDAGEEA